MTQRSRARWVFIVSLAAHAWLVGVIFVAINYRPAPIVKAAPAIDTTVDSPIELQLFDEVQIFPAKVVPLPLPPHAPPAAPSLPLTKKSPTSPTPTAPTPPPSTSTVSKPTIRRMLHRPAMPGQSIVYVLDRSASMGEQGRFRTAKAYLLDTLRATAAGVRVQVVLYNRVAELVLRNGVPELVELTPACLREVEAKLNHVFAEGTSSHTTGLKVALSLSPAAVFLLTDADDLTDADVRAIRESNHAHCSIHTVRFAAAGDRLPARSSLSRLAHENHGSTQLISNNQLTD